MRLGCAIDLHATRRGSGEVVWENVRAQARLAEDVGFDIVLVPDHLLYVAGGEGGYAQPDESVGVWESFVIAGALAEATTRIELGHSMVNVPYRSPTLVANAAATLDQVSGGRYQLGIGSGNSFDYDAVGVDATRRAARFAEAAEIIHGLLKHRRADVHGELVRAVAAERVLEDRRPDGPPLVIAARGPRAMRVAARYGDSWNGEGDLDPQQEAIRAQMDALDGVCAAVDRDPATLGRTVDVVVDPLDRAGVEARARPAVLELAAAGVDEVRCYLYAEPTHASRMAAIEAMRPLVADAHDA